MMKRLPALLLSFSMCSGTAALAADVDAMIGGAIGGGIGAAVGSEVGGRDGAIAGAAIGGAVGAAVATDGNDGHDRHDHSRSDKTVVYVEESSRGGPPGHAYGHRVPPGHAKHKNKHKHR